MPIERLIDFPKLHICLPQNVKLNFYFLCIAKSFFYITNTFERKQQQQIFQLNFVEKNSTSKELSLPASLSVFTSETKTNLFLSTGCANVVISLSRVINTSTILKHHLRQKCKNSNFSPCCIHQATTQALFCNKNQKKFLENHARELTVPTSENVFQTHYLQQDQESSGKPPFAIGYQN